MIKKKPAPVDLLKNLRIFYRMECYFCEHKGTVGEVDIDLDYVDSVTACISLFRQGWREVTSKHYECVATACPACPACAKKKDKDR